MSEWSAIYIFFALYCGVPQYETPIENAAWVVRPLPDYAMDQLHFPDACWLERDPGFPAPWSNLPGADPEFYDI